MANGGPASAHGTVLGPTRRGFLAASAAILGSGIARAAAETTAKPLAFRISLAEWSLHKMLFTGKLDNLLIMCDGLGNLGDPDEKARTQAIENHFPWVEAAKRLGCHAIRVNAASSGDFEEQQKLAADGLTRLSDYAAQMQMNVIVENHGGLSSNGGWLAGVMKLVDRPNCGTLPDFGNFHDYDRYRGMEELMPFAKGVSAKSHEFDAEGNEVRTDYRRMMKIVLDAGYSGWVGIEYEGKALPEPEGIVATKKLLERVRDELAARP